MLLRKIKLWKLYVNKYRVVVKSENINKIKGGLKYNNRKENFFRFELIEELMSLNIG